MVNNGGSGGQARAASQPMLSFNAHVSPSAYALRYLGLLVNGNAKAPLHLVIELRAPLLAVSDLHLDGNRRDLRCVGSAAARLNARTIVIVGDLFDLMHDKPLTETMLRYAAMRLGLVGGRWDIVYVAAVSNHDPRIPEAMIWTIEGSKVLAVSGAVLAQLEGSWYLFVHGDNVISNGPLAFLVDIALRGIVERISRRSLGVDEKVFTVMGHTHMPMLDLGLRTANAGTWVHRFLPAWNTALLIPFAGTPRLLRLQC